VFDLFPLKLAAGPQVSTIIKDTSRLSLTEYIQLLEDEARRRLPSDVHHDARTIALFRGQIGLVETLLSTSSDMPGYAGMFSRCEPIPWSPLDYAAAGGQDMMLKYLLKRFDLLDRRFLRTRAFGHAARAGHSSTVKLLLEKGVTKHHDDVLLEAISRGHTEVVHLLLEHGKPGKRGRIFGQHCKHRKELRMMISNYDALIIAAAQQADVDIVRFLLDYAAKEQLYEKADPCQVHPLWHAFRSTLWRGHHEIICLFLDYGVDVNDIPISDCVLPPLHIAVLKKDIGLTATLLDWGAVINSQDHFHRTALFEAVKSGQKSMASYLLDRGADINIEGQKIKIPLSPTAPPGDVLFADGWVDHLRNLFEIDSDGAVSDVAWISKLSPK
jgi:ankyrin repeat protein